MAWSIDTGNHSHLGGYNDQKDILFYEPDRIDLNFINAIPSKFCLFTPNVIHITNIKNKTS